MVCGLLTGLPGVGHTLKKADHGNIRMTTESGSLASHEKADSPNLVDVVERVLDKGIVIDAWVRVSLVGLDLLTIESRVVLASIETYLQYARPLGSAVSAARPFRAGT